MTEDRVALFELIDQSSDDNLVRDMLAFAAGRMMEMEARTGAAPGARSTDRKTYRIARPTGMATRREPGTHGLAGSSWISRSCARPVTSRSSL